jgi:anti-sigma B factor antagonist
VSLQISTRKSGDVIIMDLRGGSTLNDGESDQLSRRLGGLIASGVRKLLLNLRDVTHIDSSGVSIFVETYVSLERRGGGLKLLCTRDRVLEVLTVFRLREILTNFEDETEALTSFQSLADFAKP